MTKRNRNFIGLKESYLFPEINARKKLFMLKNPQSSLISLGIGDTTEPIPEIASHSMSQFSLGLGTPEGYSGYGSEQGIKLLRELIASQIYQGTVFADDIFISDGAKCDIGRLQMLFGPESTIAVQDPAYPVYVDGSLINGIREITYMPCTPENNFFPNLETIPRTDLIYFCSPNNPTGAAATRRQLQQLVAFAKANNSIVIFDSAYSCYIQNPDIPKSIFEINGAEEVAIEVSSFSKLSGFTGVRLGWTVVPDKLKYEGGGSVKSDWNRLTSTIFNGASNIAQQGGCAILSPEGLKEVHKLTRHYMENASLLKDSLQKTGREVYGGENAPYLWVYFKGQNSWDVFQDLLENYQLITTPGSGFGPSGEGFIRLTAFGSREQIQQAIQRLNQAMIYA